MDDPVLEQHFVGHKGTITSLSFNPSDKQLLSSSEDHTFMNWNLTSSSGSLRYAFCFINNYRLFVKGLK